MIHIMVRYSIFWYIVYVHAQKQATLLATHVATATVGFRDIVSEGASCTLNLKSKQAPRDKYEFLRCIRPTA